MSEIIEYFERKDKKIEQLTGNVNLLYKIIDNLKKERNNLTEELKELKKKYEKEIDISEVWD